ncbi:MAG: cupredoxin domain-containing protein [Proteobacteria bacterium]|nr:cupredoxin domain-containing protein [Pseudomonadota bacterium]
MRKPLLVAIAVANFLLSSTLAQAKDYAVKMLSDGGKYRFEPQELKIQSGDQVTWVNAQDDMHGVMSESVPENSQPFESPMLEKKGQQWSHVFTTAGTYRYHCHPHETVGMKGVIIVEGSSKADLSDPANKPSPLMEQQAIERLQQSKPVYSCGMKPTWFSPEPGQCPCCTLPLEKVKEVKGGKAVFESGELGMQMDMKDMKMESK